jgi:UDP-glucose:glycoprotein glucosyltransferase
MYSQLAEQSGLPSSSCSCHVTFNGHIYTDPSSVYSAITHLDRDRESSPSFSSSNDTHMHQVFSFDHTYTTTSITNNNNNDTLLAVLYAPLGAPCIKPFHTILSSSAEQHHVTYIWRPISPPSPLNSNNNSSIQQCQDITDPCSYASTTGQLVIPAGYGIELALKNMEYNARDDDGAGGGGGTKNNKNKKEEEGDDDDESEGDDDNTTTTTTTSTTKSNKKQQSGLQKHLELAALSDQALFSSSFNITNLGLQAMHVIKTASDPLLYLRDISQNLPLLAQYIAGIDLENITTTTTTSNDDDDDNPPRTSSAVSKLSKTVHTIQRAVHPSTQVMMINGLSFDVSGNLNFYDLLDTLRKEVALYDTLRDTLGLSDEVVKKVVSLRGQSLGHPAGGGSAKLDLRSSSSSSSSTTAAAIMWLNDLERDNVYKRWPRRLTSLLHHMYPGQLPKIGRNVFNFVYAFDPATPAAFDIADTVAVVQAQKWPIRFGIIPYASHSTNTKEKKQIEADEVRMMFGMLTHHFGPAHGMNFLSQCGERLNGQRFENEADFLGAVAYSAKSIFKTMWTLAAEKQQQHRSNDDIDYEDEEEIDGISTTSTKTVLSAAAALEDESLLSQVTTLLKSTSKFAVEKGITRNDNGLLIMNGNVIEEEGMGWQGATVNAFRSEMPAIQEAIYTGTLKDNDNGGSNSQDVYEDILLKLSSSLVPRYNPKLLPPSSDSDKGVRLPDQEERGVGRFVSLTGPILGLKALKTLPLRYNNNEEEDGSSSSSDTIVVTHWVVAGVSTKRGVDLAIAAIEAREAGTGTARIGVVTNPRDPARLTFTEKVMIGWTLASSSSSSPHGLASQISTADILDFLASPPSPSSSSLEEDLPESFANIHTLLEANNDEINTAAMRYHEFIGQHGLGLVAGSNAVVTNGRVIELEEEEEEAGGGGGGGGDFSPHDFLLLEAYAAQHQFTADIKTITASNDTYHISADAAAVISSALTKATPRDDIDDRYQRLYPLFKYASEYSQDLDACIVSLKSNTTSNGSPLSVQAVINPLGKQTQQISPVIKLLHDVFDADTTIIMNPQLNLSDPPLQTMYRYVLPSAATDNDISTGAVFSVLPIHHTLTLGIDVPDPWLVAPVTAQQDLDNLRLDDVVVAEEGTRKENKNEPSSSSSSSHSIYAVHAVYELEALLLFGSCIDLTSLYKGKQSTIHPRGVQLHLGTPSHPHVKDTLVMSNLGYFQLKAAPGVWNLKLAPGRSDELFQLDSSTGTTASSKSVALPASGDHVAVSIAKFSGRHMHLFVRKDPSKFQEDVLEDSNNREGHSSWDEKKNNGGGILSSLKSFWQNDNNNNNNSNAPATTTVSSPASSHQDTIHVFTIASGHMYERLQKIMILSVIKRTKSRVKFWFIENYMSPQMKAFVPHMASQYDFDYEFITYKWPSWLHKQTEKQRIIWAYKILFLDVLFPLDLKKVIFCDSDQVIRADLQELWDMDLQGTPYGYTPFCGDRGDDGNTDTEGFRFWKHGFWKDHLQGRPYHISALYVVDLERFRAMAAGDKLRVIYDGLSRDPHSLSNLDQDLPNYSQMSSVPIFSLPQEWLWCETWCGNATRKAAKTIDLCNNPATKEPKLVGARRIIAEWPALDREAEEFTKLVESGMSGEELRGRERYVARLAPMVEGTLDPWPPVVDHDEL